MKRVTSDLIYGVPPLSQVAAPPGLVIQEPESFEPEPDFTSSFRSSAPTTVEQCREAGPNDFPQQPAPNSVTAKPKEGFYLWKLQGSQKVSPFPTPFRLSPFTDRSVDGVRDDSTGTPPGTPPGTNFRFTTKQRDPSLNSSTIITQDFLVDQTNPSPELRGVLLTRIEKTYQNGEREVFTPNPPILLLPLPVQVDQAAAFDTTAVDVSDPQRIQTLAHRGHVERRERVDACGTVIDSWLVDGEQELTVGTEAPRKRNYDYSIAPHFGGMIVFEHSESPCGTVVEDRCRPPEGVDHTYDTSIGQTEPDPPRSR